MAEAAEAPASAAAAPAASAVAASHRDALLAALAAREVVVPLGGVEYTVREIRNAADLMALQDGEDIVWKLLVRCTYGPDGALVFSDADLPALKEAGLFRRAALITAVKQVNGIDADDNRKK